MILNFLEKGYIYVGLAGLSFSVGLFWLVRFLTAGPQNLSNILFTISAMSYFTIIGIMGLKARKGSASLNPPKVDSNH